MTIRPKESYFGSIQIVIFSLIFIAIMIYISKPGNEPKGFNDARREVIAQYIEEDYFKDHALENADFSEGLLHWRTSDGGELFRDYSSKIQINTTDFHSSPQSLEVIAEVGPSRIFYVKDKKTGTLDDPYALESGIWMGVRPGQKVILSYWHKGGPLTVKLLYMFENGNRANELASGYEDSHTEIWKSQQIYKLIPQDAFAIAIVIMAHGNKSVLIDDMNILVE